MRPEPPALQPGLIALHGNRAEDLAEAVITWLGAHPLGPLEEEVVLVQSNGMGEWFKMEMARHLGVCAATRVELPARFLWRTYRQVLGAQAVPLSSPLDPVPMAWRLMRVLPTVGDGGDRVFDSLRRYLGSGAADADRRFQLALQLADLYDQYQNHRVDWLLDWAEGRDVLRRLGGAPEPLPADQRWQAVLWRQVLDTLPEAQRQVIRPALHQQVVQQLTSGVGVGRVARRVVVFGMGHLPHTTLTALAALAQHSQVLLAVPNPCCHDWGDIMDGRELLNSSRRRHPAKGGVRLAGVALQDMHQHAHPLLAAWGRQGRDFIRQLDAFDDAQATLARFPQARIDLFDTTTEGLDTPCLRRLQQHIRDLVPVSPTDQPVPLPPNDQSVVFHMAHSPVRELEVLHDQLLDLLAGGGTDQPPLQPRDVVVMVPDIAAVAPAVRAVFGQYPRSDPRHIPFDIADLGARESSPVVTALDTVLRLSTARMGLSDLQGLLDVPAVARRFGVDPSQRPLLDRWMAAAGIRWGLDGAHRAGLGLGVCGEQNTLAFGLQRLLMGYATGGVPADQGADPAWPWAAVEPLPEVGGLDAAALGGLADLLRALTHWWAQGQAEATPAEWVDRGRGLLSALFDASGADDTLVLAALNEALTAWLAATEAAGCGGLWPLSVFRRAWLGGLDAPRLDRRFRAGGVTFCTLMPMRAIPFEVVCLVGMNGPDYPRHSPQNGWDLMAKPGLARPGDRSRQQDDRQLMLEALLSARRCLYVSWAGRSVRDNTEQPPSVLVAQLRDHIEAVWGPEAVAARTTQHPLQPFSRRYFEVGSGLHTHSREWRELHTETPWVAGHLGQGRVDPPDPGVAVDWRRLLAFFRNPARAYCRERLGVFFDQNPDDTPDTELFDMDPLSHHRWLQDLVDHWPPPQQGLALPTRLAQDLKRLQRAGALPMGAHGEQVRLALQAELEGMARAWQGLGDAWPDAPTRVPTRFAHGALTMQGWLAPVCQNAGERVWVGLTAGRVLDSRGKPRPDRLIEPWFRALVAAACQAPGETGLPGVWVARDAVVHAPPLDPQLARDQLATCLEVWWSGLLSPCPLPLKTALACADGQGPAQQRAVYEGGVAARAEVADMHLARCFPTFADLVAQRDASGVAVFDTLAPRVYTHLLSWVATDVRLAPHPLP